MAHDFRLYGGLLSGLPSLANREPGYVTDQPRFLVGNTGYGNTLLGVLQKIDATASPGVNDDAGDGYSVGSVIVNVTGDSGWLCVDDTIGAAIWVEITAIGSVADGDYGDVIVSGSGSVWTIDATATLTRSLLDTLGTTGNQLIYNAAGTWGTLNGSDGILMILSGTLGWVTTVGLDQIVSASANSKLLGSGDTGSGLPYEEITLGTNLSMSGTTLNAAGGGTVTTTGSPASGNLAKFSGATSITNGDLSGDVTTSGTLATTIANDVVTYAKMQNVSAKKRALGRNTAGSGDVEECTITNLLDWLGTVSQGDIAYRGAASWANLSAGNAGNYLKSGGAGANPSWDSFSNVILRGAYGSKPSAGTAGRIYNCNNSIYRLYDDGSNWQHYVENIEVVDPNLKTWTQDNSCSATYTTTYGGVIIAAAAQASAHKLGAYYYTAPSAPYSTGVIIGVRLNPNISVYNFPQVGWSDGTKYEMWSVNAADGTVTMFSRFGWTNSATYSASAALGTQVARGIVPPYIWYKLVDDNTNLVVSISFDRTQWYQIDSQARLSFLANCNKIAVGIDPYSAANSMWVFDAGGS